MNVTLIGRARTWAADGAQVMWQQLAPAERMFSSTPVFHQKSRNTRVRVVKWTLWRLGFKYFSYCRKCASALSTFKCIYLCILTPGLKLYQPFTLTDENTVSWIWVCHCYHPEWLKPLGLYGGI